MLFNVKLIDFGSASVLAAKDAKDDGRKSETVSAPKDQADVCPVSKNTTGSKDDKGAGKQDPLAVGDRAPAVENVEIISGDTISLKFADHPGKPVVVEFWATWCAPCRQSIPHIDALWTAYKDKAVFVGITQEKDVEAIKKFVTEQKSMQPPFVVPQKSMRYPVAIDKEGRVSNDYGIKSIPWAFIVVDGKVVWKGHPMRGLNEALEKAINGKAQGEK